MASFKQLAIASKRAKHFGNVNYAGPFTPIHNKAGRNFCQLLDAGDKESSTHFTDICVLHLWSESINRHADTNRIAGDDGMCAALSAFSSRLFFDPIALAREESE